jgi:8-oxo-dGTP diphosphatase
MDEINQYDPLTAGAKGIVFVGDEVLVYRRDENTNLYPEHLDLPGGGPEKNESPFQTFCREVKEEFQLDLELRNIVYARRYPSSLEKGKYAYFIVAKLPHSARSSIKFGNEGTEYLIMPVGEYVNRTDAWPIFQERTKEYLKSINKK